MLYDPKWKKSVRDRFVDWLRNQDQNGAYRWSDSENCACGKFARDAGIFESWWPSATLSDNWLADWGPLNARAFDKPHTYGALLKRLEEA